MKTRAYQHQGESLDALETVAAITTTTTAAAAAVVEKKKNLNVINMHKSFRALSMCGHEKGRHFSAWSRLTTLDGDQRSTISTVRITGGHFWLWLYSTINRGGGVGGERSKCKRCYFLCHCEVRWGKTGGAEAKLVIRKVLCEAFFFVPYVPLIGVARMCKHPVRLGSSQRATGCPRYQTRWTDWSHSLDGVCVHPGHPVDRTLFAHTGCRRQS